MNESSPYQAPQQAVAAPIPMEFQGPPPAIKVFGILHLVFAGLGVIGAVWGLFVAIAGNPFLFLGSSNSQLNPQLNAQLAMQAKINPMTITSSLLSLMVAIPMIIAGVQLLKNRSNGLKWSNAYAYSSLGAKMINLILTITIMLPAMQEMTRGIIGNSQMPGSVSGIMSGMMVAGAIGGVLVSCIYPVLTLVFLNRPATKAWFAKQPARV
jgi:hypothetical protein